MKKFMMLMIPVIFAVLSFYKPTVFKVSGWVTDEQGSPVAAANVTEKGKKTVAITDQNGYYSITVSNEKAILVFSYVGYQVQEKKVNGKAQVNAVMKTADAPMEEVVVAGYDKSKSPVKRSYYNNVFAGKASGVMIAPSSGYYYEKDDEGFNTEGYDNITENIFLSATDNPLSTFSIDVDAASYSNVRRRLKTGQLPPAGAVRIEEMINYFQYHYPQPKNNDPFSFTTEISDAPWNPDHKLVMIGMQGKKIPAENLPASNFVFLIDVSGSMESPNKLGLVKSSLLLLVDQLREQDKVSIVVYAGAAGLVLKPTTGTNKTAIKDALERLTAGGSTAGGEGIELAYKTARENFNKTGNNRVILCTDGDFNVGASSDDEMERLIEKERKSGVFLTVLGYGMGNYKDNKMQKLADKGNGNHAYIDGMNEAKKVLVNEFGGTLFTIAKDVKLQVEFNPAKVQGYRLVGYENRMLKKEDFNDDQKDAGDMGSGHTVTAIYETIPVGIQSSFLKSVDGLKYSNNTKALSKTNFNEEVMTIKFRYKAPDGDMSKLIEHPVKDNGVKISGTSENFRFAAAVAQFGMLLRNSEFKGNASYNTVLQLAKNAALNDKEGYKKEFISLVETAISLAKNKKTPADTHLAGSE
ncbi:MAG: von Willebrand factor type A domain-containing protein [Rhizobacter sp.]|nr:von Willebrand factor type A domain-containing protein [Ferruginibacter sp.]